MGHNFKNAKTIQGYRAIFCMAYINSTGRIHILLDTYSIQNTRISQKYFSDNEPHDFKKDDYGKKYGLGVMISSTLMFIPFINALAWIPSLVFLILYIVTLNDFKKHLPTRDQILLGITGQPASHTKLPSTEIRYENLAKLKQLLDEGAITQDEFELEKGKLLED